MKKLNTKYKIQNTNLNVIASEAKQSFLANLK